MKTIDNMAMTKAQQEAIRKHEKQYKQSMQSGIRKSKRLQSFQSHPNIKTSNLRRLHGLFWADDDLYLNELLEDEDGNDDTCEFDKDGEDSVNSITNICCSNSRQEGFDVEKSKKGNNNNVPRTREEDKDQKKKKSVDVKISSRLWLHRIHSSPHIYTIDNFLSETELQYLHDKIKFANKHKLFKNSFIDDDGDDNDDENKSHNTNRKERILGKKRKRTHETSCANKNTNSKDEEIKCNKVFKQQQSQLAFKTKDESNHNSINSENSPCSSQMKLSSIENLAGIENTQQQLKQKDAEYQKENDQHEHKHDNHSKLKDNTENLKQIQTKATSISNLQLHTTEEQRTSQFIHFSKRFDSTITSIEQRACDLLSMPNDNIEPLQLVKYDNGQYFNLHHDLGKLYDDGSVELPQRKNVLLSPPRRIVTILVYLNDVEKCHGGSTEFPLLKKQHNSQNNTSENNSSSNENKTGESESKKTDSCLKVHPKRGMALVWCNITKDGLPDKRVVHSGELLSIAAQQEGEVSTNEVSIANNIDLSRRKQKRKNKFAKYVMNIWGCEY